MDPEKREPIRIEEIRPRVLDTGEESNYVVTVSWVEWEYSTATPHILGRYAEYEDLPRDHPTWLEYEARLAEWEAAAEHDEEEPDIPLRLHGYFVVEEGVSREELLAAINELSQAMDEESAQFELLRNYLLKKHPAR